MKKFPLMFLLVMAAGLVSAAAMSPSFSIQPSFGIGYARASVKIEDSFGDSLTEKDSAVGFDVDAALIFRTSDRGKFIVTPGVSVDEDTITFGVTLGYGLLF